MKFDYKRMLEFLQQHCPKDPHQNDLLKLYLAVQNHPKQWGPKQTYRHLITVVSKMNRQGLAPGDCIVMLASGSQDHLDLLCKIIGGDIHTKGAHDWDYGPMVKELVFGLVRIINLPGKHTPSVEGLSQLGKILETQISTKANTTYETCPTRASRRLWKEGGDFPKEEVNDWWQEWDTPSQRELVAIVEKLVAKLRQVPPDHFNRNVSNFVKSFLERIAHRRFNQGSLTDQVTAALTVAVQSTH